MTAHGGEQVRLRSRLFHHQSLSLSSVDEKIALPLTSAVLARARHAQVQARRAPAQARHRARPLAPSQVLELAVFAVGLEVGQKYFSTLAKSLLHHAKYRIARSAYARLPA